MTRRLGDFITQVNTLLTFTFLQPLHTSHNVIYSLHLLQCTLLPAKLLLLHRHLGRTSLYFSSKAQLQILDLTE